MSREAEQIKERVIVSGRAYVRMIDAADVLLDHRPAWTERLLLRLVRSLYTHRLRELVAVLPSDLTASEKMTGPVQGFSHN